MRALKLQLIWITEHGRSVAGTRNAILVESCIWVVCKNESGGVIAGYTRVCVCERDKNAAATKKSRVLARIITCSLIQAVRLIFFKSTFRQLDNNNINLSSQQFCRSHFTCKYFYWVFSRAWCVSATFCIADYCYVKHTVGKWPGHAPNSRLLLTQFPPFKFHILLSVKLRSSVSTISVVRYLGNR